jgi:hypothetical protein
MQSYLIFFLIFYIHNFNIIYKDLVIAFMEIYKKNYSICCEIPLELIV